MFVHSVNAVLSRLLRPMEKLTGSLMDRQYAYLLQRERQRLREISPAAESPTCAYRPTGLLQDDDASLASDWAAREGARPTVDDAKRLLEASNAGRIPRRQLAPRRPPSSTGGKRNGKTGPSCRGSPAPCPARSTP